MAQRLGKLSHGGSCGGHRNIYELSLIGVTQLCQDVAGGGGCRIISCHNCSPSPQPGSGQSLVLLWPPGNGVRACCMFLHSYCADALEIRSLKLLIAFGSPLQSHLNPVRDSSQLFSLPSGCFPTRSFTFRDRASTHGNAAG